jgi:prepilin-type N-terminal cleavage/methylation domain-containing protein
MTAQRNPQAILHRRSAFTLLELLIVIGIIALLASILILGMNSVLGTSKASSTKITLQNLQGMLGELDAKTSLSASPQAWMWWENLPTSQPILASFVSTNSLDWDFWKIPWRLGVATAAPALRNPDSLDAPTLVSADNVNVRNGARQILNTQIVMSMLLSLPTNRAALQKISADRYFTPTWVGDQQIPNPGSDFIPDTSDDNSEIGSNLYLPGMIVQLNGIQYQCVTAQTSTKPSSGMNTPWKDLSAPANAGTPPVPLLLDAWDNPIIFVPATGLRVRLLNGQSTLNQNEASDNFQQTFIVISPEGKVGTDPATKEPIVIQPGRPFFASAGPDGDFSKGDDNIYSFQQ